MCSDTSGMYRTSDDLFDTYRNLFLAFESLLSDIRPRQRVLGFVKSFGPSDRESWPRPRNFPHERPLRANVLSVVVRSCAERVASVRSHLI